MFLCVRQTQLRTHNPLPSVLLKSTQRTTNLKVPINAAQTRMVLWVKTCRHPITSPVWVPGMATGLSPVGGRELLHSRVGEEESGKPHSAHGKSFLGVLCSTSIP